MLFLETPKQTNYLHSHNTGIMGHNYYTVVQFLLKSKYTLKVWEHS